jgi:hypothetical protein
VQFGKYAGKWMNTTLVGTIDALPCSSLNDNRRLGVTGATCSSETSADFQRVTRRYIPEDSKDKKVK